MKITKIKIKNYRLLKDFELDLEDELSLIIGKNNCGKTSLLSILDKFIGSQLGFSFDDFNNEFKKELKELIKLEKEPKEKELPRLSLKLFIEYNKGDSLTNIGNSIMMDLDPNNNMVVLGFEYKLDKFLSLKLDYDEFKTKQNEKENRALNRDLFYFLRKNHKKYFKVFRKTIKVVKGKEDDEDVVYLEKIEVDKVVNFKVIDAKRNVSNSDSEKYLSTLSSKIYEKLDSNNEEENKAINEFKDKLMLTDDTLDNAYQDIFNEIIEDVEEFGGVKKGDSNIKIVSTLQHKELLRDNTTVMYNINEKDSLPEHYNGLGYMNLISMIFEIKILIHEFNKGKNENPSDINLLFIEEPEAHTHPQMQYIFIDNIEKLLKKGIDIGDNKVQEFQTIISTHSSHIISRSNFDNIKYFKRNNDEIEAKNLKSLEAEYNKDTAEKKRQHFKFLKQYLTLHRAELFFADKAIFIEGDTERILLPAMLKKIDQEDEDKKFTSLLSQNISIVEVGAYAHIFEKFIDFIGVKSLIITDIDSYYSEVKVDDKGKEKKETKKCPACDKNATDTSNESLKYFYGDTYNLKYFMELSIENKKLKKDGTTWIQDKNGYLVCIYQIMEQGYNARSFEDAFFHINKEFFLNNINNFPMGLKNKKDFSDDTKSVYNLAENCVKKKPALAMEILLNSETDEDENQFSNWKIPQYIKEGLEWLRDS